MWITTTSVELMHILLCFQAEKEEQAALEAKQTREEYTQPPPDWGMDAGGSGPAPGGLAAQPEVADVSIIYCVMELVDSER